MASSDTPAYPDNGDKQVPATGSLLPVNDTSNVETVKSKSTPPSSDQSGNKRKRESAVADHNVNTTNELETKQTETTTVVKEVEMKDAESVEIEMQDAAAAEVAFNKSVVEEKSIKDKETAVSDVNAGEGGKEENVERSEKSKDEDGSGQNHHVLGEVATLLKQVEESETKAKVEVEVKVKKLDHEDVKQNIGQVTKQDPNLGSG